MKIEGQSIGTLESCCPGAYVAQWIWYPLFPPKDSPWIPWRDWKNKYYYYYHHHHLTIRSLGCTTWVVVFVLQFYAMFPIWSRLFFFITVSVASFIAITISLSAWKSPFVILFLYLLISLAWFSSFSTKRYFLSVAHTFLLSPNLLSCSF